MHRDLYFNKKISFHPQVTVHNLDEHLLIEGPLGLVHLKLPKNIIFSSSTVGYQINGFIQDKEVIITYFQIICNKIKGVYLGFFEILVIKGIGWRVALKNLKCLQFALGYSRLIEYPIPEDIEIILFDKQCFKVFGIDINKVQHVVMTLCKLRKFNKYKGKGIFRQQALPIKLKESSKSKS